MRNMKHRRRWIVLAVVVIIIAIPVIFVVLKLNRVKHTGEIAEEELSINELDEETQDILDGYTNIALFGLDNRSNGSYKSGNSDSIMIVSINNDTKEVKLVSLYRDSYLNVYDDSFQKCNAAYAKGGPEYAIAMMNQNLDLNIEDYVAVDFNALSEVVDLLGGVELEITDKEAESMKVYIDEMKEVTGKKSTYVSAGTHNLDGIQATAYCRVRNTVGDDFKRAQRQRTVLSLMFEKAKKADIFTINKIIDAVMDDISTSLSSTDILGLATGIAQYQFADSSGFPFSHYPMTLGKKGQVVVPTTLESNVIQLHFYLFGDTDYEVSETVQELSKKIQNDTGVSESDGVTFSGDYLEESEDTEEE